MNTRNTILVGSLLLTSLLVPMGACSSSDSGGSGGNPATGGSATGGSSTGGSATGGAASGGSSTGGAATGGSATGGTSTGGAGGHATGGGGGRATGGGGGRATGGAGTGGGAAGGSDAQPATFATVKETVNFYCMGSDCHRPNENPPNIVGVASDTALYNTLTTFKSTKCGNRVLVKAGAPQDSAFYLAQADMCKPGLERMPKGCDPATTCVDPNYLEGIRQWILAGAPKP